MNEFDSIAHEDAYTKAQILHRDISIGNILVLESDDEFAKDKSLPKGLLTDWELSKSRDELEQQRPSRVVRL